MTIIIIIIIFVERFSPKSLLPPSQMNYDHIIVAGQGKLVTISQNTYAYTLHA